METQNIGKLGENIACKYLEISGYKILFRNVRIGKRGEIDIIAREKKTLTLVFVEVKSRSGAQHPGFKPEDLYRHYKQKVTHRSCRLFAGQHPELILENVGWRNDLVAIQINNLPVKDYQKDCAINHYQNV